MMDIEVKTKWVAALRSGEYEQGTGQLKKDGKFCCLGVLADVLNIPVNSSGTQIINESGDPIGYTPFEQYMTNNQMCDFWRMNDIRGLSFSQIAGEVEKIL